MTRSGRLLRLRRTAHEHPRRGPCWSPCPQSLRSFAGSTPFGDVVPHCLRQRLPLLVFQWDGFFEKALASGPAGAKRSGRGWRIACDSTPEPATAQGAECLLRSPTRVAARSKAIRARHAEGVASGHSFPGTASAFLQGSAIRARRGFFLADGGTELSLPPLACVKNVKPITATIHWGAAWEICVPRLSRPIAC